MPHTDPEKSRQYRSEYLQRPEVKAHRKRWNQEYNQRPEVKAKLRSSKVKAKRSIIGRKYRQLPEVKIKRAQDHLNSLRESYGWSIEMFKEALIAQKNTCAICQEVFIKTPHADHEHSVPPKARGLLCASCNAGIGFFKDKAEVLLKAAEYLNNWTTMGRLGLPKETQNDSK